MPASVRPWHASGCGGGRPEAVSTADVACPNSACPSAGITETTVHALVGDGHHGRDHIQDFRCQACGTKVSARRDPPLYRLTTSAMALGVTDHPWPVLAVLTVPLPPPRAQRA